MRKWNALAVVLALGVAACEGGQEPPPVDAEREARETIRRARTGERIRETRTGLDPCALLRTGVVAEVFAVEPAALTFTAGSSRHPLCTARWRKPDADEIEAEAPRRMTDYMRRRMEAQQKGQPFDEPMPVPRTENEVHLTIIDEAFASEAAAVANLEQVVGRMTSGVTVEVRGEQHTAQVDYEEWMEGVGDRAAWAPKLSQLSVAARGVVFHVGVRASSEVSTNRSKAVELARRVVQAL